MTGWRTASWIAKRIGLSVGVTVAVCVALELALAALGVRPVASLQDPYVGFSSVLPLFVEQRGPDGRAWMVTARNKVRFFNPQQFPRDKAPGTVRVFCLGGSTTYGHPYDDRTSFARWLREYLPAAEPQRTWEVINAGGISYASYRVAALMQELARYQPDLFIVYTGHNEFLEARTYGALAAQPRALRDLGARLSRTRTYAAVARVVQAVRPAAQPRQSLRAELPSEVDTMLDHSIGPEAYTRDDAGHSNVVAHFRFNLDRMVDIAGAAGARIIFVTPASSLRDCAPFKSEHRAGLSAAEQAHCARLLAQAEQDRAAGRLPDALANVDEALAKDDRYAEAHYVRGRVLDALHRYDAAKLALTRARDEDICPLRALTALEAAVRDVAVRRRKPLVDFVALVEQRSPQGIPGRDLFLDHVHPTPSGNGLLALALLDEMARLGLVHPGAGWAEPARRQIQARVEGSLDARAQALALRNLGKVFGWAGRFEEAERLLRQSEGLCPDDPDTQESLGTLLLRQGQLDAAAAAYEHALAVDPGMARAAYNLGLARHQQGRTAEEAACYRRALELDPGHVDARRKLAMALVAAGRPEEGAAEYQRLIAERPKDAEAHLGLGLALIAADRSLDAAASLQEALRLDPRCAQAYFNLGVLRLKASEQEHAAECFRKALVIDPAYASAHKNLGVVYLSQGQPARAAACFAEALRLKPDDAGASNNLQVARDLQRQGRGLPSHPGRSGPAR